MQNVMFVPYVKNVSTVPESDLFHIDQKLGIYGNGICRIVSLQHLT